MSSPVPPVGPVCLHPPEALPPPEPPRGKFALRLEELANAGSSGGAVLAQLNAELVSGEKSLNAIIAAAKAGTSMSPAELLALQAGMYRYTILVDLLGKVIAELTRGLRTLLEMKV